MDRRGFVKMSGTGVLASTLMFPLITKKNAISDNSIIEKKREVSVVDNYDVIVCGAGPAGIIAAIEAARNGAKTLVIELHGCLGGVWTSGLVCWILDQNNKQGILRELIFELTERKAAKQIPTGTSVAFDVEEMKFLLEEYCLDAGVDIRLHTRIVNAVKDENNRLTHVVTESKSGREAWEGKIFIDATGDGDLAAFAGNDFDYGDPQHNNKTQPMSLLSLIGGVKFEEISDYVRWEGDKGAVSKQKLLKLIQSGGYDLPYKGPGIIPIRKDMFLLGANQVYGFDGINAADVSKATIIARKEVHQIVNALRKAGGVWENITLVATAEQIGIREGRRIHGLYTVTFKDVVEGRRHNDAVCRATFPMDIHSLSKEHETKSSSPSEYYRGSLKTKPYDIPLRALIAKNVKGLMMAGRCISGDFLAHGSYRVTGNAAAMGEAAGKVAARAVENRCLPQEIDWKSFRY